MSSKGAKATGEKKRKAPASKKASKVSSKSVGGEKKKAKKDKDAPKRAMSGYILFSNEHRARVKEENEGIAFGAVAQELARQWKIISKAEKAKYDALAEKDKARYKKEKAEYDAKHGITSKPSKASKSKAKSAPAEDEEEPAEAEGGDDAEGGEEEEEVEEDD